MLSGHSVNSGGDYMLTTAKGLDVAVPVHHSCDSAIIEVANCSLVTARA